MYDTIMWIHVIANLAKPIEYTTLRVSPNVNYRLRIIIWVDISSTETYSPTL